MIGRTPEVSRCGEPGIVTVAPAIENAVLNLTGERIREVPLQHHLQA